MSCRGLLLLLMLCSPLYADDNLIAQKLFDQQRYAEAAEIYTDPAWKGIALYRSSQWWRAAEAFIRADDAASFHNLGNTYVELGYYELALEAYQMAIEQQPDFEDALFNEELMRKLLAANQDGRGQSELQRRGKELDRVESDGNEQPGGNNNDPGEESNEKKDSGSDREGATDSNAPNPESVAAGDSGAAGSDDTIRDNGAPEGGATQGTETESNTEQFASTGAQGKDVSLDAHAASERSKLEAAQANEQWLNQIQDNPLKFLQKKIELEIARRRQAGESAPQGGSPW